MNEEPQNPTNLDQETTPVEWPPKFADLNEIHEEAVYELPTEAVNRAPSQAIESSENPFSTQPTNNSIPTYSSEETKFHRLPISKSLVIGIIALIFIFGTTALTVNEFVLNRISSLKLISADSQFYLTLAVKKNPQAEKAKILIKKFPGGDQMLKQFDKYYANYTGDDLKNPLNIITQYADSQVLFARSSRAENSTGTSNRLISIVDLASSKDALESVNKLVGDKTTYSTTQSDFKNSKIYSIKLVAEQKLYELQTKGKTEPNTSNSTPKPQSAVTAAINKYIVTSDNEKDVKKAIDLSQTKKIFGYGGNDANQSILESSDHQQIANLFPKESFVKFFQRDPITPYNLITPYSYPNLTDGSAETEAKTYQKISRGIDAAVVTDGFKINSYSLEPKLNKDITTGNFKISSGLASHLPIKFAGVSPTVYSETLNVKAQWERQMKMLELLKTSKNQTQKKLFEEYSDSLKKQKTSYQTTYGINYETDLLSWMDGQVATIFNAGKSKKGPELLIVAEIKDQKKVEKSLKKIRMDNLTALTNDQSRVADLRSIQTAIAAYHITVALNSADYTYPDSLERLVPDFLTTVPKDPTTNKNYNYTISADKLSYTISTNLDDGRVYTVTSSGGSGNYTGVKKDPVLLPLVSDYKTNSIYHLPIFSYGKIQYSLFFTVTKTKAVIAISDNEQSLKEIVDFETKPGKSLAENSAWQKQFSNNTENVSSIGFIEPINLFGLVEYIKEANPEYKDAISVYSPAATTYLDDIETTVKGYLKTIPSIGSFEGKRDGVTFTKTLVNIVELPSSDKKAAEDALGRLLKIDDKNKYKSVLGISTETTFDKVKKDWDKFYQRSLEPIINPQILQ